MTSLLMRAQSGDYKRNIILCRELCQGWLDCQGEIVDQDWHSLLQKSWLHELSVSGVVLTRVQWRSIIVAVEMSEHCSPAFQMIWSTSPSHHHRQLSIILKSNWMLRSEKWGNGICWSWPRSLGSAAVTQNNHICPLMGIELPSTDQKRITRHRMAARSQSSLPQLNEVFVIMSTSWIYRRRNIAVYSTSCSLFSQ